MMQQWRISEDIKFEADEINESLAVSPWSGHRLFAYDLVSYLKPQRIVELGTHYGCSFFSFMQACKDKKLNTEVIAIDCWSGDEQAGFYGDEVIETVKKTVDRFFMKQNCRLIRKFFSQALADIEDETVEILHIDGLHTYEAVSQDYRSWLCKLKPDGIILFHDIASEPAYGTNTFWKEICKKYPNSYSMPHSWGLGILFPKGEKYFQEFEKNNMKDKLLVYEYKAGYELLSRQLADHITMVQNRDLAVAKCEEMIRLRDEAIRVNEDMIKQRDDAIKAEEAMIGEKDQVIARCEEMVRARDEAIKANEEMIHARDVIIKTSENMIKERDERIKQLENEGILKKYLQKLWKKGGNIGKEGKKCARK